MQQKMEIRGAEKAKSIKSIETERIRKQDRQQERSKWRLTQGDSQLSGTPMRKQQLNALSGIESDFDRCESKKLYEL